MAGHSKWANIKHRKGKADAKKGKAFSRAAKEIISAVKQGGTDADMNPRLRLAINKAKANNVPKDIIERNIKKATSADQADYLENTYELYGHGGVGIIVEAMTDNPNRTNSDLRIATNKRGGSLAASGSVAFNFDKKGVIQCTSTLSEEDLFMLAGDAGADDLESTGEGFVVTTAPASLYAVKEALEQAGVAVQEATLELIPKVYVECNAETQQANLDLIDWLEGLDDVDEVYHNMQLSE